MKKIKYIALLMLLSVFAFAQQEPMPKDFTVSGKVKNGSAGEKVFLQFSTNPPVTLDSTTLAADGTFIIKGTEKDEGNFYMLNIADRQKIVLLVEGGENFVVTTDGYDKNDKGEPGKYTVKGSENMDYYAQLMQMNQAMVDKVNKWNDDYAKATEKKDNKKMQEIQNNFQAAEVEHVAKIKALLPEMGTSLVAIFAANNMLNPERDFAEMEAVAQRFEKEKPSSKIAQSYISFIKRMKGISVGDMAPDFTLNNPEGQDVTLSSLRGKYVLIDFWASWCGPCRMENPNVVKLYDKYKDKGFAIYGVSLDKDKAAWLAAIKKDNLTWTHGSDLKFWNSAVAQTYGVSAIPATFLLDKEGKVIAKNLRGASLEAKISELLGGE
ncbi:redoxin domain-containing protein [Persicitalea sp.]|uniref:redoxin domain-containing protein n=1 Tax=Persicitalea sp. TaxID=3100273 RepID=UPI003593ED7C